MTRKERLDSMYANQAYNQMYNICDRFGYTLDRAYLTSRGEPRIAIIPDRNSKYLPDVYCEVEFDWKNHKAYFKEWKIATDSYGSLDESEFNKFLIAQQEAYRLVVHLRRVKLSQLEVLPDVFTDDEEESYPFL